MFVARRPSSAIFALWILQVLIVSECRQANAGSGLWGVPPTAAPSSTPSVPPTAPKKRKKIRKKKKTHQQATSRDEETPEVVESQKESSNDTRSDRSNSQSTPQHPEAAKRRKRSHAKESLPSHDKGIDSGTRHKKKRKRVKKVARGSNNLQNTHSIVDESEDRTTEIPSVTPSSIISTKKKKKVKKKRVHSPLPKEGDSVVESAAPQIESRATTQGDDHHAETTGKDDAVPEEKDSISQVDVDQTGSVQTDDGVKSNLTQKPDSDQSGPNGDVSSLSMESSDRDGREDSGQSSEIPEADTSMNTTPDYLGDNSTGRAPEFNVSVSKEETVGSTQKQADDVPISPVSTALADDRDTNCTETKEEADAPPMKPREIEDLGISTDLAGEKVIPETVQGVYNLTFSSHGTEKSLVEADDGLEIPPNETSQAASQERNSVSRGNNGILVDEEDASTIGQSSYDTIATVLMQNRTTDSTKDVEAEDIRDVTTDSSSGDSEEVLIASAANRTLPKPSNLLSPTVTESSSDSSSDNDEDDGDPAVHHGPEKTEDESPTAAVGSSQTEEALLVDDARESCSQETPAMDIQGNAKLDIAETTVKEVVEGEESGKTNTTMKSKQKCETKREDLINEDLNEKDSLMRAKVNREGIATENDSNDDLHVSVVTWNLAEESPEETDSLFLRRFRKHGLDGKGSDFVLISGQECENIKPRRTEGRRSREFRRLIVKRLGKRYVPIAIHQLGGIQFCLFCRRSILGDVQSVSVADVTCGIGNVFHNKGAIAAFVQLRARNKKQVNRAKAKTLKLLFVTAHLAAHVKNFEARDSDYWRIMTELEAQAPPTFVKPSIGEETSGGSKLFDAVDRLFICGDLNYRMDLPREFAEHSVQKMKEYSAKGDDVSVALASELRSQLLRHDQLRCTMASRRAFIGLAEGEIKFAPTFKYDKHSDEYDTSPKQRIPAWTDRVLFKPVGTRVIEYDSVPEAKHSDHRPVFATFRVNAEGRPQPSVTKRRKRPTTKSSAT